MTSDSFEGAKVVIKLRASSRKHVVRIGGLNPRTICSTNDSTRKGKTSFLGNCENILPAMAENELTSKYEQLLRQQPFHIFGHRRLIHPADQHSPRRIGAVSTTEVPCDVATPAAPQVAFVASPSAFRFGFDFRLQPASTGQFCDIS